MLDSDPGKAKSYQHDLILNGYEVGGGSVRIHDPKLQEKIFDLIGFTKDDKKKFEHLMELRVIVESDTASLAALRRKDSNIRRLKTCLDLMDDAVSNKKDGSVPDLDFHKEIASASGNPYLIEFIQFLNGRLKEIIKISREQANVIQGMSETVQKEHVAIFDAIVGQDFAGAREAMVRHITNTSWGLGLKITDLVGQ